MMIIHRCSCGHPDIYHQSPRADRRTSCSAGFCTANTHQYGPPEVIPTFNDGQIIETVRRPGTRDQDYDLCGCENCLALYAEVAP